MPHDDGSQAANTTLVEQILNRTLEALDESDDFDADLVERLRAVAKVGGFIVSDNIVTAITKQEES